MPHLSDTEASRHGYYQHFLAQSTGQGHQGGLLMGTRGPVPKRDAERVRANKPEVPTIKGVRGGDGERRGPDLEGEHSDLATRWYESLRTSGQAAFYEDSDWAVAAVLVSALDAYSRKPTALMLSSIMSGMSNLLVTEGDRRRVRMELEAPETGEDASVTVLDDYRLGS